MLAYNPFGRAGPGAQAASPTRLSQHLPPANKITSYESLDQKEDRQRRQLEYQEELKRQMQEKKAKEEEARRRLQEQEMREEQRYKEELERERLFALQEKKRDPFAQAAQDGPVARVVHSPPHASPRRPW